MQPTYPGGVVAGYPAPATAPQFPAQYAAPMQQPSGFPVAATPPVAPTVPGTLDGFYGQPSAAVGPSWKFHGKPIGTTYVGVVARPVTDADVRQATDNNGRPQFFRDGRPKWILIVPMLVPRSPEFPEGQATWWVKGQARDELVRAMAEAGAPAGPPEAGATIQVTLVGHRQVPGGMNPAHLYRIVYTRPTGDPAQAVAALAAQAAPVGYPAQHAAPPAQPAYTAPAAQPAPQMQAPPAQPVSVAQAAPAAQPVQSAPAVASTPPGLGGLTPQQQELMAKLVGQSAQ